MGERKVLNKYYPPDFDPSIIPRIRRPKDRQDKVRMMMPMSVRCNTCHEYIYQGKKFNSRKETVIGEDYLGIKIFRFYMKCPKCSSEFTIKTDPKNMNYSTEHGVSRNFEPWRENEHKAKLERERRERQEFGDPMKVLENKTKDNKIEMDLLDAVDEHLALNESRKSITTEDVLAVIREKEKEEELMNEEDENLLKSIRFGAQFVLGEGSDLSDDEESDDEAPKKEHIESSAPALIKTNQALSTSVLPSQQIEKKPTVLSTRVVVVKPKEKSKKTKEKKNTADSKPPKQEPKIVNDKESTGAAVLGILADYGSDD